MRAGEVLPKDCRLIAIAKERLGHESFLRDHWNGNGGLRDKWVLPGEAGGGMVKIGPQPPFGAPFPSPQLFFDTWKGSHLPGAHPLFTLANGKKQKWTGVLSYIMGGAVAANNARVDAKDIHGNSKGEGTILGAVLVLDKEGNVLFHHKEQSWGDHPSEQDLYAAINKLKFSSQELDQNQEMSKI